MLTLVTPRTTVSSHVDRPPVTACPRRSLRASARCRCTWAPRWRSGCSSGSHRAAVAVLRMIGRRGRAAGVAPPRCGGLARRAAAARRRVRPGHRPDEHRVLRGHRAAAAGHRGGHRVLRPGGRRGGRVAAAARRRRRGARRGRCAAHRGCPLVRGPTGGAVGARGRGDVGRVHRARQARRGRRATASTTWRSASRRPPSCSRRCCCSAMPAGIAALADPVVLLLGLGRRGAVERGALRPGPDRPAPASGRPASPCCSPCCPPRRRSSGSSRSRRCPARSRRWGSRRSSGPSRCGRATATRPEPLG